MSKNENCLKGMMCPKCGSEGPFGIAIDTVFLVSDDGIDWNRSLSDSDWDSTSYCECRECGNAQTVMQFQAPERILYNVFVRAEDGRHRITDEPVSFEEAGEFAREWLGPIATWVTPSRAISMYGSVLTIEEHSEEDDDGA
jgi:hypothetical protein